jgi:hypothetical protein
VIAPGDITPRRDSDHELYVVVLSNTIHLAAATGRVITCPFIPGEIPEMPLKADRNRCACRNDVKRFIARSCCRVG